MELFLHFHHFDPGEEEDEVLSLLASDGITRRFEIASRAEHGNSVAIKIGDFDGSSIQQDARDALAALSTDTLARLGQLQIDVSLRLHIGGMSAHFDPSVLRLAADKGVQIYVYNPCST